MACIALHDAVSPGRAKAIARQRLQTCLDTVARVKITTHTDGD
jgi:hypothetical protein